MLLFYKSNYIIESLINSDKLKSNCQVNWCFNLVNLVFLKITLIEPGLMIESQCYYVNFVDVLYADGTCLLCSF